MLIEQLRAIDVSAGVLEETYGQELWSLSCHLQLRSIAASRKRGLFIHLADQRLQALA
jgi:hypothetical protein